MPLGQVAFQLKAGQTHLNPHTGRTLRDGVYRFSADCNLGLSTCMPSRARDINSNSSLNDPLDFLSYRFKA